MDSPAVVHHLSATYRFRREALVQGPNDPNPQYFWTLRADGPSIGYFPEASHPDPATRVIAAKQWLDKHVFEEVIDGTVYRLHHFLLSEVVSDPSFRPGQAVWYITVGGRQVMQFPAATTPDLQLATQRLRRGLSA